MNSTANPDAIHHVTKVVAVVSTNEALRNVTVDHLREAVETALHAEALAEDAYRTAIRNQRQAAITAHAADALAVARQWQAPNGLFVNLADGTVDSYTGCITHRQAAEAFLDKYLSLSRREQLTRANRRLLKRALHLYDIAARINNDGTDARALAYRKLDAYADFLGVDIEAKMCAVLTAEEMAGDPTAPDKPGYGEQEFIGAITDDYTHMFDLK